MRNALKKHRKRKTRKNIVNPIRHTTHFPLTEVRFKSPRQKNGTLHKDPSSNYYQNAIIGMYQEHIQNNNCTHVQFEMKIYRPRQ